MTGLHDRRFETISRHSHATAVAIPRTAQPKKTRQAFPVGEVIHPKKTRDELLRIAITALESEGTKFYETLSGVERMRLRNLREIPTRRTILHPIVEALARERIRVKPTVGGVMDMLQLDKSQIHRLACGCYEGSTVMGSSGARVLRRIAQEPIAEPYLTKETVGILSGLALFLGFIMYLAS